MTLDQLLMLTTVIDLGSVQAASEKLNKTQPAISKGLRQLENQLQVNILNRNEYRLKLTAEGKQIYSHAKRILAETEILQQTATHIKQGNETELSISFDGVFDISPFTPLLAQVQQAYPYTHIILRHEFLSGAFDRLANGEVDIAISPKEAGLMSNQHFENIYLGQHSLVNVASPKLVQRHPKLVDVSQIKSEYLIMLQDSGSLTKGFEFGVLDGQLKWYVNDFQTKKQLIINDLGWGKLPQHMIQTEIANGSLVIITPDNNDNLIDIEFYALKKKTLGPVGTHLWQLIDKSFHQKFDKSPC